MKMFKKATALIMTLCMVFGVCSTVLNHVVFAEGDQKLNYVSLGDSMTNGYGMGGYDHNSGVADYAENAYPNQFADWLEGKGYSVEHAQLAMSGIRTEDIHWLLEFDYNDEEAIDLVDRAVASLNNWEAIAEEWNEFFGCGDFWTVNEIVDHSRINATFAHIAGMTDYETYTGCEDHAMLVEFPDTVEYRGNSYTSYSMAEKIAVIAKYYQENVAAADVISLSVGNGNIGVFGFGRILEVIGFSTTDTYLNYNYEDLLRECDPALKADVMEMVEEIKVALAAYSPSSELTDVVLYIAVSLVLNYAGTLDAILQSNPDVEIILVPVMNTYGSETEEIEGISLGELMGTVVAPINAYLAALPTAMKVAQNSTYAEATFYWAEPGDIECMVDTYADGLNGIIRDRFVESIVGYCDCGNDSCDAVSCADWEYGMVWKMLGKTSKLTLAQIEAYDNLKVSANKIAFAGENADIIADILLYLAFEDAIVAASKGASVSVDSVFGLGDMDTSAFASIFTAVENNTAAEIADSINNKTGYWLDVSAVVKNQLKAATVPGTTVSVHDFLFKSGIVYTDAAVFQGSQYMLKECLVDMDAVCVKVADALAMKTIGLPYDTLETAMPNVAAEIMDGAEKIVASVYNGYVSAYTVLCSRDIIVKAISENTTVNGLLALFARCVIGNGLGAHPSAAGHDELAKAVIEAYENKYTAADKTIENVVYLVSEYYDDAYAYGYAYALENGYVDAVVEAIDEAIAAVNGVELDTLGLTAELEAEVAAELAEVVEALEAAKALVLEADVLDEATLNALVAALEEANDALAQVNTVLAQAGADVNNLVILPAIEAAQEYVETVVIPAVEKAVEEAIEAAKEAAKTAAEKAYEYLVEALGDAYDYLVEAIVDAVVTYMPVVDEMLYDYFYNNPEEVIEFVKTYGPYLVPVVEEYGDEALALVGYVLYTYGEDMAAYVIENSDEILAGFAAWADKYGERTAEMLQVYAEALGLCDAVREQIAELEAALEELEAALEEATGEAKAAIEAQIAVVKAAIEELNAKVEAVIDALNNAVVDANAKVEDVIADIEAAIEDLKASVEELKANVETLINETLAAIREEIFAANRAVLEEVKALAEDILNKQIENLEDLVEALEEAAVAAAKEIKAIIDELVYEATHGEYVIDNDSFYVALGDSSAVSESYVDALAAVLDVDYANLAVAGHTTTDTLALIAEQAETIAKADLVTVGYTANIFTAEVTYTMQNILMGKPIEVYDWVALVGEDGAEYVEKALAEVRAKLVEEGLDIEVSGRNIADTLMACVEAYAYTYVEHVLTYPEIVNAIHEVAPEALVVIVGLHNTVENIVIDFEGTEIALGDYVQYAVDAANVLSLVNAILVEDTVYVDAPDVETLKEEKGDELNYDMISFVFEAIITNGADFATSENGHAYIVEQILNALTIIDTRNGLLGDADSDGDVDNVDAMLVLQYDAALIGENDLDLTVCDVNGDGLVDNVDAMLILQYDALLIEVFPVEE